MMTRRDFMMSGGAALAAALAVPAAKARAAKNGVQLGLTTYQIGSRWTVAELIEFLPRFGLFGVEIRTDMKYAHGLELTSSKAARAEAAKRFADSPVKLVGVASGERYDSPDAARLARAIERTKEMLQFCADLGAGGLRVFPNDFHKDVPQEKMLDQIATSLKLLAPVATSLGVELRLEAHGSAGLLPHLATIAKAVDHPGLRLKLNSDFRDTKGEGLAANLEKVAPYLGSTVHVHDLTAASYTAAKFYETQCAFLKRIGWSGFCLLEIGDKPDNEARFKEIAKQKQRWDELIKGDA
ncbi:MAG: TIM barrel protein [Kiritimatiellae bacterium]|jgi:sugar phosphate isomerase/epimerase|nr:TIM barrel protein [Kiritimatiellia bacterium]MDD2348828.1 TIM barrel protein [Kiritimatiellia bacterium]MDD3584165.1 TIM barrel protein [Kiritimatiellia bacterium]